MLVNFWTIMIHDGEYVTSSPLINGAACHTYHHLYFNHNYGQYTTLWGRLCNSHRKPREEMFQKDKKLTEKLWSKQIKEVEKLLVEVEGEDDRTYDPVDAKKTN
jgi:Delta7-sterol 5-desaturase